MERGAVSKTNKRNGPAWGLVKVLCPTCVCLTVVYPSHCPPWCEDSNLVHFCARPKCVGRVTAGGGHQILNTEVRIQCESEDVKFHVQRDSSYSPKWGRVLWMASNSTAQPEYATLASENILYRQSVATVSGNSVCLRFRGVREKLNLQHGPVLPSDMHRRGKNTLTNRPLVLEQCSRNSR